MQTSRCQSASLIPKGPKYLYGTKYGFCSSNFPYGLGKYSPYGHLGPFGNVVRIRQNILVVDFSHMPIASTERMGFQVEYILTSHCGRLVCHETSSAAAFAALRGK